MFNEISTVTGRYDSAPGGGFSNLTIQTVGFTFQAEFIIITHLKLIFISLKKADGQSQQSRAKIGRSTLASVDYFRSVPRKTDCANLAPSRSQSTPTLRHIMRIDDESISHIYMYIVYTTYMRVTKARPLLLHNYIARTNLLSHSAVEWQR